MCAPNKLSPGMAMIHRGIFDTVIVIAVCRATYVLGSWLMAYFN